MSGSIHHGSATRLLDVNYFMFANAKLGYDSDTNAVASAVLAAPGAESRNRWVKIDASYSDSTVSGVLTLKYGAATIFTMDIHGKGAVDAPSITGVPTTNKAEAITAELSAGGAGVVGRVVISGYDHPDAIV